MKSREIGFVEFILSVALLMALVSSTINMLLPAFQEITDDFQLEDNRVHLSISLLYLGLGISQLFYGVLSDAIGRKPTIYAGLFLFILGCMFSYLSNSLNTLIAGQVLQGIGLGAPRVMAMAIVRDKFEGDKMAQAMSFIMVIYVLTPTISPILGKAIILATSWKMLFIIYFVFGTFIFLLFKYRMPETLEVKNRNKFTLKHISEDAIEALKNKKTLCYIIILGLYSSVFIAYLNLSQAIFEFQYHLEEQYPYYFAFLALSIGLASFINGKIVTRLGMKRLTKTAIICSLLSVVPFLIINYIVGVPFWVFIVFMFIQLFNYGLLIGNLSALAMQPLGHIAGLGASAVGALSTLISVPLSIAIGDFYNNSTLPIALGFFVAGTLSLILFNFVNRISKNEKYNYQELV